MTCCICHSICGTLNPNPGIEGFGDILIVISEYDSGMDFGGSYYAGPLGRLLKRILEQAYGSTEGICVVSIMDCLGGKAQQLALSLFPTIVTLGDKAFNAITRKYGLKDKRGQWHPIHPSVGYGDVLPTYGLGDVRRVPNYLRTVVSDLQKVINKNRQEDKIEWEYWRGQEIPDSDIYGYDIETIDEKGNYTEISTQCAVAGRYFCYVSLPGEEQAKALASALMEKCKEAGEIVGHNSWAFDTPKTRLAGLDSFPLDHDTMVLAYLEDETQAKGLESLCVKHLGVKGWKDKFNHPLGSDGFAEYNARDAIYTLKLYEKLKEVLGERIRLVDEILRPAYVALTRMSERGIYISKEAVQATKEKEEENLRVFTEKTKKLSGNKELKPGSNKQVAEVLRASGETLPLTEKGNPDVSVGILSSIGSEFCDAIIGYRKSRKVLSTYCRPYEIIANEGDGRVHSQYSVARTLTGRSASSKQNSQNLPRDLKVFFSAPPGSYLVTYDWMAIEWRLAAWLAGEEALKNWEIDPLWDPHRYFASQFYRKPEKEITKEERQIAKSANFGLLFMGTGYTLVDYAKKMGLILSVEFCDKLCRTWHKVFPGFGALYLQTKEELLRHNEVRTITGHIRHFGDVSIMDASQFNTSWREAVNVKVQGLAAHIAFLTMAELDRLNQPMVNFTHDSFTFEFSNEGQENTLLIERVMMSHAKEWIKTNRGIDITVPLPTERQK